MAKNQKAKKAKVEVKKDSVVVTTEGSTTVKSGKVQTAAKKAQKKTAKKIAKKAKKENPFKYLDKIRKLSNDVDKAFKRVCKEIEQSAKDFGKSVYINHENVVVIKALSKRFSEMGFVVEVFQESVSPEGLVKLEDLVDTNNSVYYSIKVSW